MKWALACERMKKKKNETNQPPIKCQYLSGQRNAFKLHFVCVLRKLYRFEPQFDCMKCGIVCLEESERKMLQVKDSEWKKRGERARERMQGGSTEAIHSEFGIKQNSKEMKYSNRTTIFWLTGCFFIVVAAAAADAISGAGAVLLLYFYQCTLFNFSVCLCRWLTGHAFLAHSPSYV